MMEEEKKGLVITVSSDSRVVSDTLKARHCPVKIVDDESTFTQADIEELEFYSRTERGRR